MKTAMIFLTIFLICLGSFIVISILVSDEYQNSDDSNDVDEDKK